jgi:UTP--glucose-1-phosphate uridylyltransferase
MHVLTPAVQEILAELPGSPLTLSAALARLPSRERYLALQMAGRRYDLGARYGVLTAQLALALSGPDRPEILAQLVELLSATGTTA